MRINYTTDPNGGKDYTAEEIFTVLLYVMITMEMRHNHDMSFTQAANVCAYLAKDAFSRADEIIKTYIDTNILEIKKVAEAPLPELNED